ncbi:MAG: flavodoxin [Salinivirgaceae bacterium]|jgi:flavodoxin I
MKNKIAVLYGPVGGNTERIAKLIANKIGIEKIVLIPVKEANKDSLSEYKSLIIGGSTIGTHTWSHKNTSSDWDQFMPTFKTIDFTGKKVAIFGLGDQLAYTNNFVDDMRTFYNVLVENGATVIGQWPTEGYEFNESAAIVDGKFVGLPLNEDHEEELSDSRIESWLNTFVSQL